MDGSHEVTNTKKEFLGVNELADYLGISAASVYRMVERRSIRFYRLARYLRFRVSDVDDYLTQRLVKPLDKYERTQDKKHVVGGLPLQLQTLPSKES